MTDENNEAAKEVPAAEKPGFSGIFSITSPLEENKVPISSSSGSIVAMAVSASTAQTAEDVTEDEEDDYGNEGATEKKTQEPPSDLPLPPPPATKGSVTGKGSTKSGHDVQAVSNVCLESK